MKRTALILCMLALSSVAAARDFVACDLSNQLGLDYVQEVTIVQLKNWPGVQGTANAPRRSVTVAFSWPDYGRMRDFARDKPDPFGQHAFSDVDVATFGVRMVFHEPRQFANGVKSFSTSVPFAYIISERQMDGAFMVEFGSTNPNLFDPGHSYVVSAALFFDPSTIGHSFYYSLKAVRGELSRAKDGRVRRFCPDGDCVNYCTATNFIDVIDRAWARSDQAYCLRAFFPSGARQSCARADGPVLK